MTLVFYVHFYEKKKHFIINTYHEKHNFPYQNQSVSLAF